MKSLYALALIATIWAHHAHADELDDRIANGINAYADNCPQCGGWMMQLFDELRADASPTETLSVSTVKNFMIRNQRQDGNITRDERMGTLAHSMQTAMGTMENRTLSADEFLTRTETYLDIKYPPPPEPERIPIPNSKWSIEMDRIMSREAGIGEPE